MKERKKVISYAFCGSCQSSDTQIRGLRRENRSPMNLKSGLWTTNIRSFLVEDNSAIDPAKEPIEKQRRLVRLGNTMTLRDHYDSHHKN